MTAARLPMLPPHGEARARQVDGTRAGIDHVERRQRDAEAIGQPQDVHRRTRAEVARVVDRAFATVFVVGAEGAQDDLVARDGVGRHSRRHADGDGQVDAAVRGHGDVAGGGREARRPRIGAARPDGQAREAVGVGLREWIRIADRDVGDEARTRPPGLVGEVAPPCAAKTLRASPPASWCKSVATPPRAVGWWCSR